MAKIKKLPEMESLYYIILIYSFRTALLNQIQQQQHSVLFAKMFEFFEVPEFIFFRFIDAKIRITLTQEWDNQLLEC
jgi:hypothetical protein